MRKAHHHGNEPEVREHREQRAHMKLTLTWKSRSTFDTGALVDHEHNDMVIGLDHGIVMRDQYLMLHRGFVVGRWPLMGAHNGADGCALGRSISSMRRRRSFEDLASPCAHQFQRFRCAAAQAVHRDAVALAHVVASSVPIVACAGRSRCRSVPPGPGSRTSRG